MLLKQFSKPIDIECGGGGQPEVLGVSYENFPRDICLWLHFYIINYSLWYFVKNFRYQIVSEMNCFCMNLEQNGLVFQFREKSNVDGVLGDVYG